jgi:hypothetical protein
VHLPTRPNRFVKVFLPRLAYLIGVLAPLKNFPKTDISPNHTSYKPVFFLLTTKSTGTKRGTKSVPKLETNRKSPYVSCYGLLCQLDCGYFRNYFNKRKRNRRSSKNFFSHEISTGTSCENTKEESSHLGHELHALSGQFSIFANYVDSIITLFCH